MPELWGDNPRIRSHAGNRRTLYETNQPLVGDDAPHVLTLWTKVELDNRQLVGPLQEAHCVRRRPHAKDLRLFQQFQMPMSVPRLALASVLSGGAYHDFAVQDVSPEQRHRSVPEQPSFGEDVGPSRFLPVTHCPHADARPLGISRPVLHVSSPA